MRYFQAKNEGRRVSSIIARHVEDEEVREMIDKVVFELGFKVEFEQKAAFAGVDLKKTGIQDGYFDD